MSNAEYNSFENSCFLYLPKIWSQLGIQGGGGTGGAGLQGFQGFQGIAGGGTGSAGLQGFQGFQGRQGDVGIQGQAGSVGTQGSQGPQGLQGVQGLGGSSGSQGVQGVQGFTGPSGGGGGSVPICILYMASSVQSPNTFLSFGAGTEVVDTDGFHSTTVNPTRITPTVAGYYQFNLETSWIGGAEGVNMALGAIELYKNGSMYSRSSSNNQGIDNWYMNGSTIAYANGTTDYFEAYVFAGGFESTTIPYENNRFACYFVRS